MKILSVFLSLVVMLSVFAVPFVSAAPAKKPELNVLVFGNEHIKEMAVILRSLADWQGVNVQIGVLASEDGTIENHLYSFKNDFNYCWDRKTGLSYLLDNDYPGGFENNRDVKSISAKKLINKRDWDVVVMGASMKYSGSYNIIEQHLPDFLAGIKSYVDDDSVKYLWHEQWALEEKPQNNDPDHDFHIYDYDMQNMYNKIKVTCETTVRENEFDGIVYTGEVFNVARTESIYSAKGTNLLKEVDGTLSMHGQYLAAITWYLCITECKIDTDKLFIPTGVTTGISEEEALQMVDIATTTVTKMGITLKNFDEVFVSQEEEKENVSSELVYNPDDFGGNDNGSNLIIFIVAGVVVAAAAAVVVLLIFKKKKK